MPPISKNLFNRGENKYKGGGTRPKPSKEKRENMKRKKNKKNHHKTNYGNL